MPNLYGNLVANTAAGIAGGKGVMPGGNVGDDHAVFEQAMMLRHLQFPSFADRLETALKRVISEGDSSNSQTKDLGGDSSTQEVVVVVLGVLDISAIRIKILNKANYEKSEINLISFNYNRITSGDLTDAVTEIDKDGNDVINLEEFADFAARGGGGKSKSNSKEPADINGVIGLEEFTDFAARDSGGESNSNNKEIGDVFEMYDRDNNSLLTIFYQRIYLFVN
ncbi:hypothetical protein RHSIM_Rhsim10G0201300 [Rhododendron simsii]|uniref:EF-hand domain-containing protein n=1 Tax=Rhododendron simsii TaxID=118357 RepID=A0A834G8V8_RHOSS|nr:hypothetical protein RHSIM_Rhsim10G0201300 [Rhododendron simsii]